jgi:transcriptional regulator GlxA family with amidase domain
MQQRLQRAGEMLQQTNDSISSIASRCGFADQSHLTRMFRAAMGSSPAAWRRQRKARLAPLAARSSVFAGGEAH